MKKNLHICCLFQKSPLSLYTRCINGVFSAKNGKFSAILLALTLIFSAVSITSGTISTAVFLRDSNTPVELVDSNSHIYQDIMVGTKLKIVVSSDTNEFWGDTFDNGGSLAIEEEYWPYGILSARGPLIDDSDWSGSHLPAAGNTACVYEWYPVGFDLYTGAHNIVAGDWFVIDYNALDIGNCNVGFYDHQISWDVPIYYLCFTNVRTRDFNNDTAVNFQDYAILASYWSETNCTAPNWCGGTDLNTDNEVNTKDLMLFCEFWLEKTE
jgi:hypothetical protein